VAEPGDPAPPITWVELDAASLADPGEALLAEALSALRAALDKAWNTADSAIKAILPPLTGENLQIGRDYFLDDEEPEAEASPEPGPGPQAEPQGGLQAAPQGPPQDAPHASQPGGLQAPWRDRPGEPSPPRLDADGSAPTPAKIVGKLFTLGETANPEAERLMSSVFRPASGLPSGARPRPEAPPQSGSQPPPKPQSPPLSAFPLESQAAPSGEADWEPLEEAAEEAGGPGGEPGQEPKI
jgi:hypothetical protein